MNKKFAAIGLATGLVAGGAAGLILEMSTNAGAAGAVTVATDPSGTATPSADRTQHLQDALKGLVADGTITQAQADKVIAAIEAAEPAGGHRGDHRGMGRHGGPLVELNTVATTLGITEADVRTAIQGGQTIAQLAVSKGKTAQDVIDALVAAAKTSLDAKVTAKTITQAQADTALADAATRITDFVNNTPHFGMGMGGHGPGHRHDDGDGNAPSTTVTSG